MDRFAPPNFTEEARDLFCPNVDCPGRKGERVAVHFVGTLDRQDHYDPCPYCGTEGKVIDTGKPLLEQLLEPDRRRVAAEELAARAGVEDE